MTKAEQQADEIAQLRKELTDLKAKVTPEPYDPAAAAKWASDLHALREARMAHASAFSRADLEAMEAAAPTSVVKDIALRDARAPQGPSSQGPASQTVSNVPRGVPGGGTGWQREIPLSSPPGIHHIDRLMAHEDIEFRRQRIAEAQALKAVTEEKPSERPAKEGDA